MECVIMGLLRMLPAIWHHDPPAGILVTGYALSVRVCSAFSFFRCNGKRKDWTGGRRCFADRIFILGNLLCALAPNSAFVDGR